MTGRLLTLIVALSGIATATMMRVTGETLTYTPLAATGVIGGGVLALVLRFGLRDHAVRWRRAVGDAAETIALFAAVCLLGAIASYPDAAQSIGFVDPALARIDAAIGFDWVAWYAVVAAHPMLQIAGRVAYQAIYLSPALLLGHYAWAGMQREARAFIAAFWLAAVLTLLLFPHLPSLGPLAYLWHGPIPYMPTSALYQPEMIPALRGHLLDQVDVSALRGLVGAPSFHTASGVVYLAFGWRIARLRWPIVAINTAMLLSTPVEGTHYLADMIVGALVAAAAVSAVRLLQRPVPALPARLVAEPARKASR